MYQIFRVLKCRCYAFKFPFCKQLNGNGLPLTTTAATLKLKIIYLIRKELQHGEWAQSDGLHVVTRRTFFRALELCRQEPAVRRNNTRHERGVVAPHSADTGTSRRQSSYLPIQKQIYIMVFSTSTRDMERFIFVTHLNIGFQNGTFA